MRISSIVIFIWLVIGIAAAGQRDYFTNTDTDCGKVSTIALTIVSGPLNYVGINPRVECTTPQPSA